MNKYTATCVYLKLTSNQLINLLPAYCGGMYINVFECSCHVPELDECESDPCQNGGTCQDESKKYSCSCLAGYNGNNCETGV